jgi:hypothetical protein
MDPKTVVKEFWASYNRGNLDETWKTYVTEDVIFHPTNGVELGRGRSITEFLHPLVSESKLVFADLTADRKGTWEVRTAAGTCASVVSDLSLLTKAVQLSCLIHSIIWLVGLLAWGRE